jgi:hypothetical protein
MPKYSLNLAESYVPEWGAWEVGREMICNARDADPSFTLKKHGSDELELFTDTVPTLQELTVLGLSQSRDRSEAVGQFGEGFKLASLVAVRSGGGVTVLSPHGTMHFLLESVDGSPVRVLHAHFDRRTKRKSGCVISVTMPGIVEAIRRKFTDPDRSFVEKEHISDCRVYCKGVFISEIKDAPSIWDWNLNSLKINRDRAVVSGFDVRWRVSEVLRYCTDEEVWRKIFSNRQSFETNAVKSGYGGSVDSMAAALSAWKHTFGEKAVIASEQDVINQTAAAKGYSVVIFDRFTDFGIPTAESVVNVSETFTEVIAPKHVRNEIEQALDLLEVPATVRFFEPGINSPLGQAVLEANQLLIWLSGNLLKPGNRAERLSTLAHEIAHVSSKAGDATLEFEQKLDKMVGKLLVMILERR